MRAPHLATGASARGSAFGAAAHNPEVTSALSRALVAEWARVGFSALSLEAVAKRAKVGKAALYRRWPSKLVMVSDTFARNAMFSGLLPDRGSLRADLDCSLRHIRRVLRHPVVRRILPDLHAEVPRSPDLARLVRERIQTPWQTRIADVIGRAVIRRELPADQNIDLGADMVLAMMYWRIVVTGDRADDEYLDNLAATIMLALGATR